MESTGRSFRWLLSPVGSENRWVLEVLGVVVFNRGGNGSVTGYVGGCSRHQAAYAMWKTVFLYRLYEFLEVFHPAKTKPVFLYSIVNVIYFISVKIYNW